MNHLSANIAALSPEKRALLTLKLKNRGVENLPIAPISPQKLLPLSFAQERIWLLEQFDPGGSAYTYFIPISIKNSINLTALSQSFNEIIQRHEALRTTFITVEEQPVQKISPTLTLDIPVVDLRELADGERETEVIRLATKIAQQSFDLTQGPLLYPTLIQLSDTENLLLFKMHYIICDVWSLEIFQQELTALYEAFSTGKPSPLPRLPIQYANFTIQQRQLLQGQVLNSLLTYWRQQLSGNLPALQLPVDGIRPVSGSFRGAGQSFSLSKNLTEALKKLSLQEGSTLFMTLLAAFKTLLYRYTGQEDVIVGSPIANRNQTGFETLIGFFSNILALRTDLSGNPSFRELLSRVRKVTLEAYAHRDLPFKYLMELLQLEGNLYHQPPLQVVFEFLNVPTKSSQTSFSITGLNVEKGRVRHELFIFMSETEQGLQGRVEYSTDLFNASTITWIVENYQTLLADIINNPEQRLT
jgi:hypothetical protein